MSSSPLLNRVDGVFIHVRNLRRAAEWYSAAFGVPLKEEELQRHYYTLNVSGEQPWVTLDDHGADPAFEFQPAAHPILSFYSRDLSAAREHLRTLGALSVGEIEEAHPGLAYFVFRDPDGNALMALQRS
ncbi:VOC family protein [Deinococcus aluminii]|uniref:VOC domain-containing protein n=1 Tax=Deinococcus aluminii TaxID=1656885 RepID=A0ABP9XD63_9DEIO